MKNKIRWGILCGGIAGVIDVIPMILQNLTWDANLGAFSMWVIVGFFVSTSALQLNYVLKSLLYSFLTLVPSAFIIGWNNPMSLIPIFIMTIILGSFLGFILGKFFKVENRK
ncbi:MAG: hypothetical protein WAR79_12955 [Melioribacteraceae bacterium]